VVSRRGVAPASAADLHGPSDEAHGNRVFLRHYGVHIAGPHPAAGLPRSPADARAASTATSHDMPRGGGRRWNGRRPGALLAWSEGEASRMPPPSPADR
jgi:hypothetical protein